MQFAKFKIFDTAEFAINQPYAFSEVSEVEAPITCFSMGSIRVG